MSCISLEHVKKSFGQDESDAPVRSVSLEVSAGELVSIVGPSGTGKSTLLNLMGGLLRPDAGTVSMMDRPIAELSDRELTALRLDHVGFIFQEAHLIQALTVRENLAFIQTRHYRSPIDTPKIDAMLEAVGLTDRAAYLPCHLSVGQRRRAVIAAALIKTPGVILADEPTNDLDPFWADAVMKLLQQAAGKGAAVVVVTHHEQWASSAARRYRMEQGRLNPLSEDGPHREETL